MNDQPSLPTPGDTGKAAASRLPVANLLALAMACFIAILTETLPAGLLPQISQTLNVSEALTGQIVTVYAVGSLAAAIPLTVATNSWGRRSVLLVAIAGFFVFNTITTFSGSYALIMAARLLAGVAAGLCWGVVAGYARRMVADPLRGRAMAIAMVGTPLALSFGTPAGAFLGSLMGWRFAFGTMSALALILIPWIVWKMPNLPGTPVSERLPLRGIFLCAGVRSVLLVILLWILGHNILYTYIAPLLALSGLGQQVSLLLLVFGVTALLGIWVIGLLVDRWLRLMTLLSLGVFALAAMALGLGSGQPAVVYGCVAVWGVTFGGAATLLQTAIADAAGSGADIAQSMVVTAWNTAIAGGGIAGGILLETLGAQSFSWVVFVLVIAALVVALRAKSSGFPLKSAV